MAKPIVAIVGRPNVGKSTIFNKLTGQRLAIVEDTPGVTRDRIFCDCEWSGHKFLLVDTGGIEPRIDDGLLAHMRRAGPAGHRFRRLHRHGHRAFCRCDPAGPGRRQHADAQRQARSTGCQQVRQGRRAAYGAVRFLQPGPGRARSPFPACMATAPATCWTPSALYLNFEEEPEDADDRITVAVIGRPNVGKSSLINHILGENRLIVANEAGTTRDAIDTMVENKYGKFVFTDTAGLRKKGKVESGVERYSVLRSLAAVERSRVCVIMIDATVGFTEQDSKVAGYAHEQGKACIIAVNKWDAVEKDSYTMDTMRKKLEEDFSFMSYAPIVFISAKTGQRVDKLFETIHFVDIQNGTRVPTGALERRCWPVPPPRSSRRLTRASD